MQRRVAMSPLYDARQNVGAQFSSQRNRQHSPRLFVEENALFVLGTSLAGIA